MKHKKLKLFLDANIFFAGSASTKGGSAFILEACQNQVFQAVTTRLVLQEAKKNIIKKLKKQQLERFLKHIKTANLLIQPPSTLEKKYQNIITPKDTHVLSGALASKSDYLITLDIKHFFTEEIKKAKLPLKIATPKEFIVSVVR